MKGIIVTGSPSPKRKIKIKHFVFVLPNYTVLTNN